MKNQSSPRGLFNRLISLLFLAITIFGCQPQQNSGFAQLLINQGVPVQSPANLRFPEDHGQHPEFGIEWWYLTANMENQFNTPIWMQWTLFRIRTPQTDNTWSDGQFYMAHFSAHTASEHFAREKFAEGGVGNVAINSQHMFIDNWIVEKDRYGRPARLTIKEAGEVVVDLSLNVKNMVMLQGDNGYSEKYPGSGLASYYYSLPDINVNGKIQLSETHHQVTGQAWFDHEWSSAFLNQNFIGWQWFSLHLKGNQKLMLFALKPAKGSQLSEYWYGKYRTKNNETISLLSHQIQITAVEHEQGKLGSIANKWQLKIPDLALDVAISSMKREQISPFSILYYEGAVSVTGSTTGVGFVEITQ